MQQRRIAVSLPHRVFSFHRLHVKLFQVRLTQLNSQGHVPANLPRDATSFDLPIAFGTSTTHTGRNDCNQVGAWGG